MAVNTNGESMKGDVEADIRILSKRSVQPTAADVIHLNSSDLSNLLVPYMSVGLLFGRPQTDGGGEHIVSDLFASFSHALRHFYPLAGRLVTADHEEDGRPMISFSLHCAGPGAEFIHASAPGVKTSDVLQRRCVPVFVYSFFPLEGLVGRDGVDHPLLAAQVTELADGLFIACAMNHVVLDGYCFWHFFNTWSRICRTGDPAAIEHPPVFGRWFPDSCPVPIHLRPNYSEPPEDTREALADLLSRPKDASNTSKYIFDLSADGIKKLKARAIEQTGCDKISSLQAVAAHTWRAFTRARRLQPEQSTWLAVVIGYRSRQQLKPPVSPHYFGNIGFGVSPMASAKEVIGDEGLGQMALRLNETVAGRGEEYVYQLVESFCRDPWSPDLDPEACNFVVIQWSPRFDVFGNDFGWGAPVAVRVGAGNGYGGMVGVFPGPEPGSMCLSACLTAELASAFLEDDEFMSVVS